MEDDQENLDDSLGLKLSTSTNDNSNGEKKNVKEEQDIAMEADSVEPHQSSESGSPSLTLTSSSKNDNDSGLYSKSDKMDVRTEEANSTQQSTEIPSASDSDDMKVAKNLFVEDWETPSFEVACNVTVDNKTDITAVMKTIEATEANVPIDSVSGNEEKSAVKSETTIRRRLNHLRNYRNYRTFDQESPATTTTITQENNSGKTQSDENCAVVTNELTAPDAMSNGDNTSSLSTGENSNESPVEHHSLTPPPRLITDDSNSNSSTTSGPDDHIDDDDDDDDDDDGSADIHVYNDEANHAEDTEIKDVLNKPKPNYTWNSIYELMRREQGLNLRGDRSLRSGMSPGFNARYYSSRHVVERMELSHCLQKHHGCVNCLNFNRNGELLCTGSDDTRIIIWNWAQGKPAHEFKSGHTENIFQTKFIDTIGCLDIVSASRDGQVRRSVIPPSGGKPKTSCLYKHHDSVHKLVICPKNVHEIISAGEDGYIRQKDLRIYGQATELVKVTTGSKNRKVRLFSISHHPFADEICVCGCDNLVRVYDKRNMSKTVHDMCPEHLVDTTIPQVTCSVYNHDGSEILSSYSDDHIYLFNNKVYKIGEYLHRYRGHYNHRTIKGVNFFGPNSEYIVSGSDCGNIFFWDKNTEAIINFMWKGDTNGVVNCLEPHPSIPVLATSGLDHDIKIWTPSSEKYPPDFAELEYCVKRNLRRSVIDEGSVFDDRQFQYFIRQFMRRPQAYEHDSDDNDDSSPNVIDAQMWSGSSSSSSSEDEYSQLGDGINCRTQ